MDAAVAGVANKDASARKTDSTAQLAMRARRSRANSALATISVIAIMVASGAFSACASSAPRNPPTSYIAANGQPVEHVVRPGETVYHIAHAYGVSVHRLLEANHLSDARDLRVGQSLLIPGSYGYASLGGAEPYGDALWNVPRASRQFAWPVWSGNVTSGFGVRHGTMHDGIDIAAPIGTPVHAADAGTVVFTGRLNGYGNTVIIRHTDSYVTVYGHNSHILVSPGMAVARGQTIAAVGTSGRTTGPNLHFEVRYDNRAYTPLGYLAPPGPSPGVSFARNGAS